MWAMYPTDITKEEEELGFELGNNENPSGCLLGQPATVPAVVCKIGPHDRVVKNRRPDGQIRYRAQRLGWWPFERAQGEPKWLPAGNAEHFRAGEAIEQAKAQIGQEVKVRIITPDESGGNKSDGDA